MWVGWVTEIGNILSLYRMMMTRKRAQAFFSGVLPRHLSFLFIYVGDGNRIVSTPRTVIYGMIDRCIYYSSETDFMGLPFQFTTD